MSVSCVVRKHFVVCKKKGGRRFLSTCKVGCWMKSSADHESSWEESRTHTTLTVLTPIARQSGRMVPHSAHWGIPVHYILWKQGVQQGCCRITRPWVGLGDAHSNEGRELGFAALGACAEEEGCEIVKRLDVHMDYTLFLLLPAHVIRMMTHHLRWCACVLGRLALHTPEDHGDVFGA